MTDMTVGMISAVAAERIPIDRTVRLNLEGWISVLVEKLAILLGHRRRLFLVIIGEGHSGC
ncbi:hypothetical protein D3C86_2126110 [compost metagenome]